MPKEYINPPSLFRRRKRWGNALRESFSGSAKPATTWIGVVSLADPGFLIEIEATAVLE